MQRKRKLYLCVVAVAIAAFVLPVVACGGEETTTSSTAAPVSSDTTLSTTAPVSSDTTVAAIDGVAKAQEYVANLEAPPKWVDPGPAFDATKASGKRIFVIADFLSLTYAASVYPGMDAGLEGTGVKVTYTEHKGEPATAARMFEQGIGQKYDLIICQVLDPKLLVPSLDAAQAAGIPVLMFNTGDPHAVTDWEKEHGIVGNVTESYTKHGYNITAAAIALYGKTLNATSTYCPDIPVFQLIVEGSKQALADFPVPEAKVEYKEVLMAQIAEAIPVVVQNACADKSKNVILPWVDAFLPMVTPSILAANAQDRVGVVTGNAAVDGMTYLSKGEIVKADLGVMLDCQGWALLDQALRVLTGQPALADANLQFRMFTENNIGEIDVTQPESTWYGIAYQDNYRKLWGIK